MKFALLLIALLTGLSMPAWAEDAEQRLKTALKNMDNLSAEFKQTLLDEDKNIVQQSSGTLALQRPGKFAWIYTEPFEQRIIADGSELWVYDVELDQVTVKPMDASISNAPIMILMKETDVTQQFKVIEVGQRKFLYWIELKPQAQDLEYQRIFIGLEDGNLRAMELQDQFGQSTQIVFDNLRVGVVHNPATFKFVPPDGVDVYGVGG
ncbi:MAG: outer membrane lipoprotein chaperone LolA, partial [Gammaproteobacteria bacterium]|nr:outer membrane lipoprotein chaperone LolA [Gammaproteobacteria bacterium]MBT8437736.1 outer membrane lipoprotein chaperone LolA [Gammaproteobacteria bacterium]